MSVWNDASGLIVAGTAAFAAVGGWYTARRGRQDAQGQQQAANTLQARDQSWKERGEVIADLRVELDRCKTARDEAETDREYHRDRADRAEDRERMSGLLVAVHEVWDSDRVRDQPSAPQPPPLRLPRQRESPE